MYDMSCKRFHFFVNVEALHAGAMDTAKFSFRHLQTFCNSKNRTFRENVVIAHAESIFIVYGKMFPS